MPNIAVAECFCGHKVQLKIKCYYLNRCHFLQNLMLIEWLSFLLIGVFAGLSAGLFGLGGGVIVVPALLLVLSWRGFNSDYLMHSAVATSLMTIIVTSISSIYSHQRHANIDWSIVVKLSPGLIIGAVFGAYFTNLLTSDLLQFIFGFYLLIIAIKLWLPEPQADNNVLVKRPALLGAGTAIGFISALLGIGGGSLTVPYLLFAKQTIRQAIGVSAVCGLPISISAALIFMWTAPNYLEQEWMTGYIYWPAFLGIIMTSLFFAIVGAKLTQKLPMKRLQQLFSFVLLTIAMCLIF